MLRCWCCYCPLVCYTFRWPICSAIPAYPLTDLWNLFILLYQMRYLKNKKSTLLHCSHCGKNFSARSRSAQYCARHTAGSVQLEQRAVHGGVRIVPELISFDDLRDKFLPPGSRSRATHYGNWVGISKARGLAPSCYSSVTLDGWIRKISVWLERKTLRLARYLEVLLFWGKLIRQGRNLLGFSLQGRASRRGGSLQGKCLFIDVLSASRFSANKHLVKTVR